MDFFLDFFIDNFQNCVWLAVLLIAMCPTFESKIAIPLAMNTAFWGMNAFTPFTALFLGFLGSIIPSFFLILISRKIKTKTAGFFTSSFFKKYQSKCAKIESAKTNFKKYLMLTCFVSIPVPLTGVWTGSIIAGFSNLDIKYSFLSIILGALISASSITLICTLFNNSLTYIFMISLFIIVLFLFFELIFYTFKKEKRNRN